MSIPGFCNGILFILYVLTIMAIAINQLQVQNLAQRLQLPWNGEEVTRLMAMVGGHPWLVKEALYKNLFLPKSFVNLF
ncbi:AAA-like domain-containing protein [Nostoc sp.]|uniref:AAA-like domain-containing protein n=1 Tax=Nostoc sp. TaxID=1180 RepID=UPI002FFD3D9B